MKFRINTSDLTTIKNKDEIVIGCEWNGYQDNCKRCSVECPVRPQF
jgi:hypothetical protein